MIVAEEESISENVPNAFTTHLGAFSRHWETAGYTKAKHEYFFLLSKMGTKHSLLEAILQGRDILRLEEVENLEIRNEIPGIFLRLGTNSAMQECYDFIKFWTRKIDGMVSVCSDMCEVPFSSYTVNMVALTVIKIRLQIQLKDFLNDFDLLLLATARGTSPATYIRGNQGVLCHIADYLKPDYSCFTSRNIAELRSIQPQLIAQASLLIRSIHATNSRIWKIFVKPDKVKKFKRPIIMSPGSAEEALLVSGVFLPLFIGHSFEATVLRSILIDYVGNNPEYDIDVSSFSFMPF